MSDQSQGPGWWLASDGRWYPPDQAPAVPPPESWAPPPAGPPRSGRSTGAVMAIAAVVGLVGLLLVGIVAAQLLGDEADTSSSSTGAPIDPGDLPEGYARVEGDGVSIAAPDTWEEVDPQDFGMSDEELAEAFPDAPEGFMEQAVSAFDEGAVLVAFDLSAGFSANVNIGEFPGEAPLGLLESQATTQIETIGGVVQDSGRVQLPIGEASRIEYTLDVAAVDGSTTTASGVQYYVPSDGHTYVVTITTGDEVTELGATMIETFRVG